MTTLAEKTSSPFILKGSLFTITVLQLQHCHLDAFKKQLETTINQAPKFFHHAPIAIDLNSFDSSKTQLNLSELVKIMRELNIIPIGIRGGDLDAQQQAISAGIAILHNSTSTNNAVSQPKESKNKTQKAEISKPEKVENKVTETKVITQPVRSGQQIYAKGADLIILSSVSHGAEVLADGHIHVYGPLRGRALAGIMGNTNARIFCKTLEAELISIAGRYLVSEHLTHYKDAKDLHIHLQGEQLKIESI